MPDTIPAPPKQMSRFDAQRKLGLFATHDFIMLGLIVLTIFVMASGCIFGRASIGWIILGGVAILFFQLVWLLVLAYRIMVFVLDLHADIALLPEAAARIAAGYFEGRVPASTRK